MALKYSANDLRLKPGEEPTPKRLAELFEGIQRNFEDLGDLFPLQGGNLANSILRLAVAGNQKAAFGTSAFTWSGASAFSTGPATVTHGLGKTPSGVFICPVLGPGGFYVIPNYANSTATTFQPLAFAPQGNPPAGSSTFSWLVIG